jgi:L-lactate dehydrogenase complex protein LldF
VRAAIINATDHSNTNRGRAYAAIDAERWRDWARDVKTHVLTNLDRYLEEAEASLTANGVRVHWAETAADALTAIRGIVREHDVRSAIKGKSMLTEELGVNAHLEGLGVHVREGDLGEYIVQLLGEMPSHIVGPAIHKSLEDCRRLFHERLGTPLDGSPETLARAARETLREEFLAADMGITGGNFLADRHRHHRAHRERGEHPPRHVAPARARRVRRHREARAAPRGRGGLRAAHHARLHRTADRQLRVAHPGPSAWG